MAKRKRLSAEDAKARILEAAIERLHASGPRGLKLTTLAKELGTSHQAILHHFGSRDELVGAVVDRALDEMQGAQLRAFAEVEDPERMTSELLHKSFEIFADQGYGRLFAWLALDFPQGEERLEKRRVLEGLASMVDARHPPGSDRDPRETRFMIILLTYAVLGSSIFAKSTFKAAGLGDDPDAPGDFRDWLVDFVVELIEGLEADG